MAKALVLGAGIVGITMAYELWRDGHEVTVVDREVGAAVLARHAHHPLGQIGPVLVRDIQGEGRRQVVTPVTLAPGLDRYVVFSEVAGLPYQVRELFGEVTGVLAGAAADLEDILPVPEKRFDDRQDGLPVLRA